MRVRAKVSVLVGWRVVVGDRSAGHAGHLWKVDGMEVSVCQQLALGELGEGEEECATPWGQSCHCLHGRGEGRVTSICFALWFSAQCTLSGMGRGGHTTLPPICLHSIKLTT